MPKGGVEKLIIANLENTYTKIGGAWQYDYGQVLRLQKARLPTCVEVHFSYDEKCGEAITRIATTKDGVTDVVIPDSMLENNDTEDDYKIYAFVYLSNPEGGETEYKIAISVKSRPRPEAFEKQEDTELFREAIKAVNESSETAQMAAKESESWAHGHADYPDREKDNALYYAKIAKDETEKIKGKVTDSKRDIDRYVEKKKEDLKGETGNVRFAAFKVVNGRLKMYSDPKVDKVRFVRSGSRLTYRLTM